MNREEWLAAPEGVKNHVRALRTSLECAELQLEGVNLKMDKLRTAMARIHKLVTIHDLHPNLAREVSDLILPVAELVAGIDHFVSKSCGGETCRVCGLPATHKVGEEIPHDDPHPNRHNLTAYVCCAHFTEIMGAPACRGPVGPDGPAVWTSPDPPDDYGHKPFDTDKLRDFLKPDQEGKDVLPHQDP